MSKKCYVLGIIVIMLGIALLGNMMEKGFNNVSNKVNSITSDIIID